MMSAAPYHNMLAAMRAKLADGGYEEALEIGRNEIERGCGSSDLLLLMATAGQLSDGVSCSLEDIRAWLEQASQDSPDNPEAWLELGHFLDAVADQPQLAASAFQKALERSVAALEAALEGLDSTASTHDEGRQAHIDDLRRRAQALLKA